MSDQTFPTEPASSDASLADAAPSVQHPTLAAAAVERILTLEAVMESARLVETKAVVCLRGDLEVEYADLMAELASLVDEDGNVVGEEQSLVDEKVSRVYEIQELAEANRQARLAESYAVLFRAMPADIWEAFERTHRERPGGPVKKPLEYEEKLIAACAIAPTLTEADVQQLRKKLSAPQMDRLFRKAYEACTTGGLDIPKSLFSSLPPRLQG